MNILVVDDEPVMREAYSTLIDWEENGFSFVGSAGNGLKALEMMRKTPVDIVITDMKMPVMSGLELIEQAQEEFPETRFIVMSGFDDFSLVKEAFKMGVKEYFLKLEIDPDTILKTLTKLKKEIEEESRQWAGQAELSDKIHQMAKLEKLLHHNHGVLCEKLLKELIWGSQFKTTVARLEEYEVYLNERSLSLMVFSLCDYYAEERENWQGEREIFKYAILNVLDEICKNYGALYPFCNLPHEFVVIHSPKEHHASGGNLKSFFEDIRQSLSRCFGLECDCGYSGPVMGYEKLRSLYQEAECACRFGFVAGHGNFVDYKAIKRHSGGGIKASEYIQEVKKMLSVFDSEQIKNNAYRLRISANSVHYENIEEVKNLFYLYYIEVTGFFEKNGMSEQLPKSLSGYEGIKSKADLRELNNWLTMSVLDIAEVLERRSDIEMAKQYINLHYSEPITRETAAEFLGISTGHLSRLFQKSGDESFTGYLLKVRMEAAVTLLKTTNLKVYEVAERVGYSNIERFSKMFKKVMGKSPKAFRK